MSIIKIEKHKYSVDTLMQWDRNQTLEIYGLSLARAPEVHFSNMAMDRAITRQATMDSKGVITVSVPNGLLQKPYTITAHLCQYNGATFETLYTVKIPVNERKQPADYTIEDDGDVYSFNALDAKVNQAVADMKAAEQSMGEKLGPLVEEKVGGAVGALIDTTLGQSGKVADAKAVSDTIAALKTALSGTVLWENPDDGVEFVNQKVALDLTKYKSIRIVWYFSTYNNENVYSLSYKIETFNTQRGDFRVHSVVDNQYRGYTVADDGINFTSGNSIKAFIPGVIIGYDF